MLMILAICAIGIVAAGLAMRVWRRHRVPAGYAPLGSVSQQWLMAHRGGNP